MPTDLDWWHTIDPLAAMAEQFPTHEQLLAERPGGPLARRLDADHEVRARAYWDVVHGEETKRRWEELDRTAREEAARIKQERLDKWAADVRARWNERKAS